VKNGGIVFVVDDDRSVREGVADLLSSVGVQVKTFATADDFLHYKRPDAAACLVLDVRLPGSSGLELQREIARSTEPLPVIFITGHGDVRMSVTAMKAGAVEFLTKPFREQELLDAVHHALAADEVERERRAWAADVRRRYELLTTRERQVMALVVSGQLNKQIAGVLGTSEVTVKVHRGQVMHKMKADSAIELLRMAEAIGIVETEHHPSRTA